MANTVTEPRKSEVAHTWLPPELVDELKVRAEVEDRSISALIRRAVASAYDPNRVGT